MDRGKQLLDLLVGILLLIVNWIYGMILVFIPSRFLEKDVSGQVVLITGGASGIGRIMAEKFASLSVARVVIWDINEKGLTETKDEINEKIGRPVVESFVCDISDRRAVYETARLVKQNVGVVDILVNNAGIVQGKRFLETDDSKMEKVMEVNAMSHFWTVKAFLPDMIAKKTGHIVAVASIAGLSGGCNMTDYCASKFANLGFMEALMYELKSDGYDDIHTTAVCPWYIDTGLFAGVEAGIIPLLKPKYVAKSIVSAIRRNQEILYIPRSLYFMYTLKTMLPMRAMHVLFRTLNGHRQMDTFVGRGLAAESASTSNKKEGDHHHQPEVVVANNNPPPARAL